MHRQSLGSPNSKLHSTGVLIAANDNIELLTTDDFKIKQQQQLASQIVAGDDEQLRKLQKPHKSSEKLIHIIPMLIIFCFLILYLTSHDPSQKGVSNLEDFKRNSKAIEISTEIDDIGGVSASGVLALRSSRNLQEEFHNVKRSPDNHRLNRKLGQF